MMLGFVPRGEAIAAASRRHPTVALVRGPFLNAFECQSFAPLTETVDITAFASLRHLHALEGLPFPVVLLPATPAWPRSLRWAVAVAGDLGARLSYGEGRYLPGLSSRLAGFDLVHTVETAHGFSGQALDAKRRYGCRVVVTVWENIPFNRKGYSDFAFGTIRPRVLAEADAFHAVTERARDALILEGADPSRVHIIPLGVDMDRFRPAPPQAGLTERLGLPADRLVVLSVGTMSVHKGIATLLHAVKRASMDPDLRKIGFVLVLVGRDVGGVRNLVANLGLADLVCIVDYVPYPDMPALYNLAAISVLPSVPTPTWQEQFGMVLVESLASGTPILASSSGCIPEVVNEAGLLVPSADHVALYRGLKELLLDPGRRETLGRLGRQRAKMHFDCNIVAERIGKLYASLL